MPDLADQGIYIGSQRSFYRVLLAHGQQYLRGRARLPQEPRPVPRLKAKGPNQVWGWDIFYLPTRVKRIWLYLNLVVDIWSRKVVAWDVEQSESAELAAQLVSRAYLKERIGKRRSQPLILHADNGTSCVLRRWRYGWRSWGYSDPSLGQGFQTTIPIPNFYSALLNAGLTIQTGLSEAKKKPANGFQLLWIGTTTDTAIAAPNSLGLTSVIAVKLLRSAASVPASMS